MPITFNRHDNVQETLLIKGDETRTVKVNDRVFVVPEGSIKKKNLMEEFRIAQVLEIKGGPEPPCRFRVRFYKMKKEIGDTVDLSPTELLLGQEEWITSYNIIDVLGWYFRQFNDSIPNPPRMNSKIWFHRRTKTLCTICQQPYQPHQDRQRFCHLCGVWFHLVCLGGDESSDVDFKASNDQGPLDEMKLGDDGLPVVFGKVLEGPTTRGHGGVYNFENNWLNTGSGVQKGLVRKWRDEGVCPEDWLVKLGENFLQEFLTGKTWTVYTCPICGGKL